MIAPASRKIGKFEIRRKLGRGGMADVYLAQDTESGQTVALKLIEHSSDADTCSSIEAEMRGATLQARLAEVDPRVVRVYGAGDLEGFFHVAMEYIDGQDLAELMRDGRLEVEFAVDTALSVAQTLENAHKLEASVSGKWIQGIVHGDIKPKNIRIDSHGKVRVLDFGIAKALSLSRKLTRNEFGSVPYASPERLEMGEVNVGSDLWSLAVMLYEMVVGMQPYQADSTERMERMIRSGIAPPPAPDPCPEALRRILMKALAPDPEVRYQSAASLGMDLAAFRAGGKIAAAAEDIEATRRTYRRPDPDQATRRTSDDETRRSTGEETRRTVEPGTAESAAAKVSKPVKAPTKKPRGELFYWANRGVAATLLACVVWAAWAAVSDYRLYQHGLEFEREVTSEQVTDPGQIWTQWAELSKDHPSSIFLRGARQVAREKFIAAADHTIDRYRNNDGQPVYENEWQRAHTMVLHALSTQPGDKALHGKLRLCEGQVSRIEGTAHNDIAQLNDAIEEFQEAQRSMPQSPDPALGLARSYLSLRPADVDKAAAAFQQAETNGYQMGNREESQMADAYRDRANRAWRDSFSVRGLPQEKDEIQRAAADYQRALDLYQKSSGWGSAALRIAEMQASLDSAKTRLQQIELGDQDPVAARHNRVAGAIIGLINALRNKSTRKDSQ